jgi:succinate dehydrogenase / fumarate reductase cytochrome b subunit
MWLTTIMMFSKVGWAAFYVIGMFILGLHLFHAISSAFQTLGIAHQKWTPIIEIIGMVYSVVVAGGFLIVAAGSFILANKPETQSLIERSRNLEGQKNLEQLKEFQEQKKSSFVLPASDADIQVSYVSTINGGR